MSDDETCTCGHAYDEHDEDEGLECTVDGCDCRYYEQDEQAALA